MDVDKNAKVERIETTLLERCCAQATDAVPGNAERAQPMPVLFQNRGHADRALIFDEVVAEAQCL